MSEAKSSYEIIVQNRSLNARLLNKKYFLYIILKVFGMINYEIGLRGKTHLL